MHIPDGYLGPTTCAATGAVMVPLWAVAVSRLKQTLRLREVPMLALGAAFCFVIMLFNIPIPGGSTGHAVGAVLVAILFGPWAAVVVVSLALIVQALLFGDGGVTAVGANCLTMAAVMPWVGWGVYHALAGDSPAASRRRWWAAAVGGYLGLTAAAVAAGFLFGLQPALAHDAAGRPLYCPFGLRLAVPAMALEHLLVFSFVEAVATGLVIGYLQRTAPEMLARRAEEADSPAVRALVPRLAAGLGLLIVLSPVGLYLPQRFGAGSAWGEWSSGELAREQTRVGQPAAAPAGVAAAERHGWAAPLPDYGQAGPAAPFRVQATRYVFSGLVGVAVLAGLLGLLRRGLARKEPEDGRPGVDARTPAA